MGIRVLVVCAAMCLCTLVSPLHAQMVTAPPTKPLTAEEQSAACAKFYLYRPNDLVDGGGRNASWRQDVVDAFVTCVTLTRGRLQGELAQPEKSVHEALESEFNRLRHLVRWYDAIRRLYNAYKSGKSLADLGAAADTEAHMTDVFEAYRFYVNQQLQNHGLLQPFSGVLKAGAAFLERGSSTSPDTTPAADTQKAAGSSTTSGGSPLAHIDFESKHFGADKGSKVEASFTSMLGFVPALAFFKPAPKTINGETTNAAEATAYQTAFVFNVGGNVHVSTFQAGELSITGRAGAVNLMSEVNVVDQGGQSYVAIPFGGDNTRLYGELGVQANLYNRGIEAAHLEKSSLMPLFHAEAGLRQDPRFDDAGAKYFRPGLRSYIRVSADNVPVFGQINGEAKTFSLGFSWEYEGPYFGNAADGQIKIPSGNRVVIRGDVNLLKALRPEPAAQAAAAGKPEAPGGLNAAILGDGRIQLSWKTDPTASTYAVYRRIDPATAFTIVASSLRVDAGAQTALYVDRNIADANAVTYQVTAFRGATESDRSAEFKPPRKAPGTGPLNAGGGAAAGGSAANQTLAIDVFDK